MPAYALILVLALFLTELFMMAQSSRQQLSEENARLGAIDITYLGNEGFLVRAGAKAVLFDALFGAGLPDYDRVPADTALKIQEAKSPFSDIAALLISHVHPDHFDLASTVRFLTSHPTTVVIAPQAVSEQISRALAGNRALASRVRTALLKGGVLTSYDDGGISVRSFPLAHGNVANAAYLLTLNGRQFLHIGDADLPMQGLAQIRLPQRHIDVAFIPFWQLTEDPDRVRTGIAARLVVPMHLIANPITQSSKGYVDHVGGRSGMLRRIRSNFPTAVIFETPLEKKTVE